MHKFWKYNYVMFAAVFMAVILCFPFLSINTAAKASKAAETSETASSKTSSYCNDDATDKKLKAAGLVNLKELGENFVYDQRYGTTNNFTKTVMYKSEKVYLTKETAQKLKDANTEFNKLGYKIKIWDAYRPLTYQYYLYKKAPAGAKYFIANPYNKYKSVHNKGAAVDLTLVHLDGSPVEMPTDFDNMNYESDIRCDCKTKEIANNRALLRNVMQKHGFEGIDCEWWHFNDTDAYKYPILDIVF